jgi:hypothetical protein
MYVFIIGGKTVQIKSYYPVIMTDRVADTAAFYQTHFGFEPAFTGMCT